MRIAGPTRRQHNDTPVQGEADKRMQQSIARSNASGSSVAVNTSPSNHRGAKPAKPHRQSGTVTFAFARESQTTPTPSAQSEGRIDAGGGRDEGQRQTCALPNSACTNDVKVVSVCPQSVAARSPPTRRGRSRLWRRRSLSIHCSKHDDIGLGRCAVAATQPEDEDAEARIRAQPQMSGSLWSRR